MKKNNFFKSNWIYILWCAFYFILTWGLLGASIISFEIALGVYTVSMLIAFSPLGEIILRLLEDVRTIDTKKEKEYLIPIFEEVYEQAKQAFPNLKEIQLYIIDAMYVNACALGRGTVAVTRGAIQTFSDEELKGAIAHEIGHIYRGHTMALLFTVVGNGIFTVIMIAIQIFANMANIMFRNGYMRLVTILFNVMVAYLFYLSQVILSINSRKNEFEADYFAYEIGYGDNLIEGLYILQEIPMNQKMSLKDKLRASHPHLAKRIARLEEIIDNESEEENLIEATE